MELDFQAFMKQFERFVKDHTKVVKKIQPTEDEALEWAALQGFQENAKKQVGIADSKKKLFWAKVELRTQEVNRPLQWNDKTGEIEVLELIDPNEPHKHSTESEWES